MSQSNTNKQRAYLGHHRKMERMQERDRAERRANRFPYYRPVNKPPKFYVDGVHPDVTHVVFHDGTAMKFRAV